MYEVVPCLLWGDVDFVNDEALMASPGVVEVAEFFDEVSEFFQCGWLSYIEVLPQGFV